MLEVRTLPQESGMEISHTHTRSKMIFRKMKLQNNLTHHEMLFFVPIVFKFNFLCFIVNFHFVIIFFDSSFRGFLYYLFTSYFFYVLFLLIYLYILHAAFRVLFLTFYEIQYGRLGLRRQG
jgi:hypothetical protein